jgi:hypothetical protein
LKAAEELLLTQRPERYAKTAEEARSQNKLLASCAVKGVLADLTLTHILYSPMLNPALTLTLSNPLKHPAGFIKAHGCLPPKALIWQPEGPDAVTQAEAEGLTLRRSGAASGYQGVHNKGCRFIACSNHVIIGSFSTVEGAALAYARHLAQEEIELQRTRSTRLKRKPEENEEEEEEEEEVEEEENTCEWVECDHCKKWRVVPKRCAVGESESWYCEMH